MTLTELRKAVRNAARIYVWVSVTADEGAYVRVSKANFLKGLNDVAGSPQSGYEAHMGGAALYVN